MDLDQIIEENDILSFFMNFSNLHFDKKIGGEYYFKKEGQKTGSISVNPVKKMYYDHSKGEGGNVRTAYKKFQNNISIGEKFIEKDVVKGYKIEIKQIKKLENKSLINYFTIDRKINKKYLNQLDEIHYTRTDLSTGKSINLYTAGMKNDSGSYNTRNSFSKLIIGEKRNCSNEITTINNGSKYCNVFEGFVDYLTYLTHTNNTMYDCIVLNSTALCERPELANYEKIYLFLDNGTGGLTATKKLKDKYEQAINKIFYGTGEDYNSWWVKQN